MNKQQCRETIEAMLASTEEKKVPANAVEHLRDLLNILENHYVPGLQSCIVYACAKSIKDVGFTGAEAKDFQNALTQLNMYLSDINEAQKQMLDMGDREYRTLKQKIESRQNENLYGAEDICIPTYRMM